MKYLKYLSLAAILIAIAGIGVKLYTGSKSSQRPQSLPDKFETISAKEDSGTWTNGEMKKVVETFKADTDKMEEKDDTSSITLWAKIIFSGLFCIAALFVVLSNKYNEETKKWAFSILTLIAGVWIGSVT